MSSNLSNKIGDIIIESQLHFKHDAHANSVFLATAKLENLIIEEQVRLLESMKWNVTETMKTNIKQRASVFNNHISRKIIELQKQIKQLNP